jgi:hypothetical protein
VRRYEPANSSSIAPANDGGHGLKYFAVWSVLVGRRVLSAWRPSGYSGSESCCNKELFDVVADEGHENA